MQKNKPIPALFCLFLTCLSGCADPLTMQGLSGSIPAAFDSTGSGTADSSWFARYDDVVQATLGAGQKLSLKLVNKTIGIEQSALNYIDDTGSKIEILIKRRTETVTSVRFDVGSFGSPSLGRLMARQVIYEMAETNKFLREWHPAEGD